MSYHQRVTLAVGLFVVALVICAKASAQARDPATRWVVVDSSRDSIAFWDTSTVRRTGTTQYALWLSTRYLERQRGIPPTGGQPYRQTVTRLEFDCATSRERPSSVAYSNPSGGRLGEVFFVPDWRTVPRARLPLYERVCAFAASKSLPIVRR